MALLTGLTPSGSKPAWSSWTLAKMVDGVDNTSSSAYMQNNDQVVGDWAKVDIGSVKTVTEVRVVQGYTSLSDGNGFRGWVLEHSTDNVNWTTISSGTAQQVVATGLSISARYLRLRCTTNASVWATFREFWVWGEEPSPEGILAASLILPTVALAGTYTPPDVAGSLAASLPVPTVAVSGTYAAPPGVGDAGVLEATLPVLTVSLAGTYTEPPTAIGTDTTSDVSLGYGYDGYGTVGDNLSADPIPAGVHLPKIMRVHQSLPAPTLVDGRPT